MTDLRNVLDVSRRLYNTNGDRFDLFTILEATTRFSTYPKTIDGLIQFFRRELPHHSVRFHDDNRVVLLQHGIVWVHVGQQDFLRMLFLPLYHCSWDAKSTELRDSVVRGEVSATAVKFLHDLLIPKPVVVGGVKLEDVPEDWRDLVVDYVKKGVVDLSKYSSVQALEHRVDQLEGLLEPDDSPTMGSQPLHLPAEEPPLPTEEREILAKTLRLDPNDFKTKRQAMELYAEANR